MDMVQCHGGFPLNNRPLTLGSYRNGAGVCTLFLPTILAWDSLCFQCRAPHIMPLRVYT